MVAQTGLFNDLPNLAPTMPVGLCYEEDVISEAEEAGLAESLPMLELEFLAFHGHVGNRRVLAFGLRYDYARRTVDAAD